MKSVERANDKKKKEGWAGEKIQTKETKNENKGRRKKEGEQMSSKESRGGGGKKLL